MNCPVICQSVQSQMADFSAGRLSLTEVNAFEQHCASCAKCQREWETFQDTMLVLSGMCQPLPCEDLSGEMWNVCAADWMMRVEMHRSRVPLWGAVRGGVQGWAMQQPRWGWVALGGAFMVFGSVWMLSPANIPSEAANFASVASEIPSDGGPIRIFGRSPNNVAQSGIELFPYASNSRRVEFAVPSIASSAADYHAETWSDPFVDHVGSGLVASSAQTLFSPPYAPQIQPQIPAPSQPIIAPPVGGQTSVPLVNGQPVAVQPLGGQMPLTSNVTPDVVAVAPTPVSTLPVTSPAATPTTETTLSAPR